MIHKNCIKSVLNILVYSIIAVSMIWTFLSAITFVRAHSRAKRQPASEVTIYPNDDIPLPRIDDDAAMQVLADQLVSLAARELDPPAVDSLSGGTLINASINLRVADSTYFYRLVYIYECSCPAATIDRYEIALKYINPHSSKIFREDHYQRLSAEDVRRFDELITIERR